MPVPVGIGSRNAAARARLVAAATELMARRGYCGASVIELAAAARASKNQLFHYFPSKEALALAALREGLEALQVGALAQRRNGEKPSAEQLAGEPAVALVASLALHHDSLPRQLAAESVSALDSLRATLGEAQLTRLLGRVLLNKLG